MKLIKVTIKDYALVDGKEYKEAVFPIEIPYSEENMKWAEENCYEGEPEVVEREEPVIFLLWGSFARSKKELITNKRHKIIESVHPSPLSANRGFFGSRPSSKINNYLKDMSKEEINW